MAWNPSPEVKVARDAAAKLGCDQIVIVGINNATGKMLSFSYGSTVRLCNAAKPLMDAAYGAVYDALEAGEAT